MNSLILAAGTGTRLRPITIDIPKCLVKIGSKSLLDWQLENLKLAGIKNINIVTGYKQDKIIKYRETEFNKIYFNKRYNSTNMVKSLLLAKDLFYTDLLISYSDIIYKTEIVKLLLESKHENVIIVDVDWHKLWSKRFKEPLDDAETLSYDKNFNLLKIGKKTRNINDIMGQYIGLMKFGKNALSFLNDLDIKNKIDNNLFMTDLIRKFLRNKIEIKVLPIKRGWLEIDSLNDLTLYNEEIKKQKIKSVFSIFN
jgi:choline kinase